MTIIVVTGHRPDKLLKDKKLAYSEACHSRLSQLAVASLEKLNTSLVIDGLALGWDFANCHACNYLQIPYIAAIPFLGQESEWKPENQKAYQFFLDCAKQTHIVSDGGYATWKLQKRNEWMIDEGLKSAGESGEELKILALWNGEPSGTKNCLDYAQKQGVKGNQLINVWDSWVKYNNLED